MRAVVVTILLTAGFFLLHLTVAPFLTVAHIAPDILLIWLVYIAVRRGQAWATAAGFVIGLLLDLTSGDGMLGLSALSKSAGGFVAGYFFNENRMFQILGGYQFVVAVGVSSLVHNAIYFLIFLQGMEIGWSGSLLSYALPAAVYSAFLSLLPVFVFSRKYSM
jgi:rod shape-determining protein MreD